MPSRADRARVAAEWGARALAFVAVAMLLWRLTRPAPTPVPELFDGGDVPGALARWTATRPAAPVHLELRSAPDAIGRDWLVALARAGARLSWRAAGVPFLAVSAERIPEPRGRTRIAIATSAASALVAADAVGLLDSIPPGHLGATITASVVGRATIDAGVHRAVAREPDSIALRRVLVLGSASWESRFVIAALEENGWGVDARLAVAPGTFVRQGNAGAIDTSRYSAVVALDTMAAADGPALSRYVRSGGGLIVAGTASRARLLAALVPATAGRRWQPGARLAAGPATLSSRGYFPLREIASDATTLEEHDGGAAVTAQRVGAGRVVQVGYDETWRLRMAGGEAGPGSHRTWWGTTVAAAAYAPAVRDADGGEHREFGDDAPLASLVARLGPPRAEPAAQGASRAEGGNAEIILAALAMLGFLAEWTSRRLRGAA